MPYAFFLSNMARKMGRSMKKAAPDRVPLPPPQGQEPGFVVSAFKESPLLEIDILPCRSVRNTRTFAALRRSKVSTAGWPVMILCAVADRSDLRPHEREKAAAGRILRTVVADLQDVYR
jgi:hypothetical protein